MRYFLSSRFAWLGAALGLCACGVSDAGVFGNTGTGGAGGDATSGDTTTTTTTDATSTTTGQGGAAATTTTSDATTTTTTTGNGASSAESTTTAASTSSGGPDPDVGCSDGTREYFTDIQAQPSIAGCAGGFGIAGITTVQSKTPQCGRVSGNDSANTNGDGCSVEDLCAEGWHVCRDKDDVKESSATGACEPLPAGPLQFWLTRQVQNEDGACSSPPDTNNITGCGTGPRSGNPELGDLTPAHPDSCKPLVVRMRQQECAPSANWDCGANQADQVVEANIVVKIGSGEGGVLCCKDL
jgi:hypothetical protein